MRWFKTVWVLLLCCCLVTAPMSSASAWNEYPTGDIDNGGEIDASDALLALQHSVKLKTLTGRALYAADVNDDYKVDASDALLILQHSVRLITVFPSDMTGEEKYYAMRDSCYGITGEDFVNSGKANLDDVHSLVDAYGQVDEASEVAVAEVTEDGMLLYTPISNEAAKTGKLNKYDKAQKITGTIELNGTVLNYSMPADVTAYDAVPIEYSVVSCFPVMPMHISATTFEDTGRYEDTQGNYFDCNLPGNVDLEMAYNGYVVADAVAGYAPHWKYNMNDTQGSQYPDYDPSELVKSGTVPSGYDYTWFNFSFKNTGNTILDSWGNGAFNFEPVLQRKNSSGNYENVGPHPFSTDNYKSRIYDYLYPGEEGDMWILFLTEAAQGRHYLAPGEYRIIIEAEIRNEQTPNGWAANYVGGRDCGYATFDFVVTKDGGMTEPNEVRYVAHDIPRNQWLGSFEEFQSSYQSLTNVSYDESIPTTGILYVQPAPWDQTVSLKIMHGNYPEIATAHLPINVESDSITIELNPYNQNYHIKEDGTREPLLMTQSMADMRGNVQNGPDARSTIVNDLRNMKEAGINFVNSTMAFAYSNNANDSFKFMMDCVRVLGFDFKAFSNYPYNSDASMSNASAIGGGKIPDSTISAFGYSGMNQANGILAKYTLARYGDLFWVSNNGTLPVAAEDTRGWLTYDHDWRFGIMRNSFVKQYRAWLQTIYTDITELNAAYGTSYSSFDEIDPRKDATFEDTHMGAYIHVGTDAVFQDGTRAMLELDLYRTLSRINDYKEMLAAADIKQDNVQFWIRSEGATWLAAGIDPNTTNAHYRQVYWEQRRNGVIPEVLAASGVVFGGSNYDSIPWSPSEVYELTKNSTRVGLTMTKMPMIAHLRDTVINPLYGSSKYVQEYNLSDSSLKAACIDTSIALFPYLKAMYEGGGIPGVMWQDYYCDGFITSTQYKELQFYTGKIQAMLATEDGQEWATGFEAPSREFEADVKEIWSYPKEYIETVIADTPRDNHFIEPYTK